MEPGFCGGIPSAIWHSHEGEAQSMRSDHRKEVMWIGRFYLAVDRQIIQRMCEENVDKFIDQVPLQGVDTWIDSDS